MIEPGNGRRDRRYNGHDEYAENNIDPEQVGNLIVTDYGTLDGSCRQAKVLKQTGKSRKESDHPDQTEIRRSEQAGEDHRTSQAEDKFDALCEQCDAAT